MPFRKKIAFLVNALGILFYTLDEDPDSASAHFCKAFEEGLDFAFASDKFNRTDERRTYRACFQNGVLNRWKGGGL